MKTSVTQFESYEPKGARRAPSAAAGIYNLVGAAKINNDPFWVVFIFNNGKISTDDENTLQVEIFYPHKNENDESTKN